MKGKMHLDLVAAAIGVGFVIGALVGVAERGNTPRTAALDQLPTQAVAINLPATSTMLPVAHTDAISAKPRPAVKKPAASPIPANSGKSDVAGGSSTWGQVLPDKSSASSAPAPQFNAASSNRNARRASRRLGGNYGSAEAADSMSANGGDAGQNGPPPGGPDGGGPGAPGGPPPDGGGPGGPPPQSGGPGSPFGG